MARCGSGSFAHSSATVRRPSRNGTSRVASRYALGDVILKPPEELWNSTPSYAAVNSTSRRIRGRVAATDSKTALMEPSRSDGGQDDGYAGEEPEQGAHPERSGPLLDEARVGELVEDRLGLAGSEREASGHSGRFEPVPVERPDGEERVHQRRRQAVHRRVQPAGEAHVRVAGQCQPADRALGEPGDRLG